MTYELADFLLGKLSAEENNRITAHLSTCEQCRREAETLKQTLAILDEQIWSAPAPSYFSFLLPRVMQSLSSRQEEESPVVRYALQFLALFLICFGAYLSLPSLPWSSQPSVLPPGVVQATNDAVSLFADEQLWYHKEFDEIQELYLANQLSDTVLIQNALLSGQHIPLHSTPDDEQLYESFANQMEGVLISYLEERM